MSKYSPAEISLAGGDEGTRTPDPLDANQMLSQLSYAPACERACSRVAIRAVREAHTSVDETPVGLPWLEQGTSVLSGPRSNQLSYRPA